VNVEASVDVSVRVWFKVAVSLNVDAAGSYSLSLQVVGASSIMWLTAKHSHFIWNVQHQNYQVMIMIGFRLTRNN
jgi:hypothetical protein